MNLKKLIILIVFTLCLSPFAFALDINSLIVNAKQYDQQEVVVVGEVLGDVMRRGKMAWINIGDKSNAIGIWLPTSLARQIKYAGSYEYKGDLIEVKGTFKQSDPEHGGDLCIQAKGLRVITVGKKIEHPLQYYKILIVIFLAVLLLVLLYLRHRTLARSGKN